MKRSYINVLRSLVAHADRWTLGAHLPDGNGMSSGGRSASGITLTEMRRAGLIEYGKELQHSTYGWRITDAGRAALAEHS